MPRFLAITLFAAALCGCGNSKPDTLMTTEYDPKEMDAAIARARGEVERFVAELAAPTGEAHSVKAPVKDGEQVEHFWLTDVSFDGEAFAGKIGNDPGAVTNVKIGQAWSVKKDEITDWMYVREGKLYGNYTMRPFFKTMPKDEAEKLQAMLAEP